MKTKTIISKKFVNAIKLSALKAYEVARAAKIHPTTLSQITNHIIDIEDNDPRVLRVAKVLGLKPRDCFEKKNNKK